MTPREPGASGASHGYRPDVEGIRGLAVLAVVLFHAGLAGVIGGFVGVDVFFVISGFLITGLLLRERERTGRIGLLPFYARRARRLLPAAIVILIATLVAALNLVAPLDRPSVGLDGAAAALSIGNIRFALAAGDYFATVSSPSPFLHFWSLAVEEQFYLVWPLLILFVARGVHARRRLLVALTLIVVASFSANLIVTDAAANWAFYSLPTRAWELGLGGLLAAGSIRVASLPGPFVGLVGWLGLAAVAFAFLTFDASLAYPGVAALVPVLGSVAMLAGGSGRLGPGRLLSAPPLRFLGRISYSLYLVHWPILALSPFVIGSEPDGIAMSVLVGLSVAVAFVTWALVETPFRRGLPTLALRPGRTVSIGLASILAVVILAAGWSFWLTPVEAVAAADAASFVTSDTDDAWTDDTWTEEPSAAIGSLAPAATVPAASGTPAPAPAATPGGAAEPRPTPTPEAIHATANSGPVPAGLRPSLARARSDEDRLRADGCLAFELVTHPADCVYGVRDATFTVALVGDSHAAQWFPALERVARHEGWRIVTFVKVSCPFIDMPVRNTALKREYRECAAFNEATIDRLSALRPGLTIVSMSRIAIHPMKAGDDTVAATGAAVGRMLARIPGKTALLVDTPYAGRDVPACLSAHPEDVDSCRIPHWTAFADHLGAIEAAAVKASGARRIDLTRRICIDDPCPVVVDDMIVFRDIGHLTATYARSLAPALATAIERTLAGT